MKDKPDDRARLLHIKDAIAEIESYTEGMNLASFENDSKTRFASIKQLEIIGEAAHHLTKEVKEKYNEVQWQPIIVLRHILVHEYYGVQDDILWRIITVHLPVFKQEINRIVEDYT